MKTIISILSRTTHKEVLRQLNYDKKTGWLTWKIAKPRIFIGRRAGYRHIKGHRDIVFCGHSYREHRLIWFWVTGEDPGDLVDHRDRDKSNNKWRNLRPATHAQNYVNSRNGGTSRGIMCRGPGSYRVRININGKRRSIGRIKSFEEAFNIRLKLEQEHYGEFACDRR